MDLSFLKSTAAQNVERQMFNLALRVWCFKLMLKCVLAKPCNPLCDQEGMRVGGGEMMWIG